MKVLVVGCRYMYAHRVFMYFRISAYIYLISEMNDYSQNTYDCMYHKHFQFDTVINQHPFYYQGV